MTKDDFKFMEDMVYSYIHMRRSIDIDNSNIVSEEYYARTEKEIDAEHVKALGILDKIETLINKSVEQSWRDNPDRMGGQFTQDEIDNTSAWR
jgi:hypothetical protein